MKIFSLCAILALFPACSVIESITYGRTVTQIENINNVQKIMENIK